MSTNEDPRWHLAADGRPPKLPAGHPLGARQRRRRACLEPEDVQQCDQRAAPGVRVAAIRQDWGEVQANYDEFRFFTGLRPSEEIALLVSDYDAVNGTLRAIGILDQLKLGARLKTAGLVDHDHLFFTAQGKVIHDLQYIARRWRQSLSRLSDIRDLRPPV